MAVFTAYKGLDVVEGASGAGGAALTDNFKELADRAPYEASSNPGVNDDSGDGFAPGDRWLNTSTQTMWACISNSVGAAVWKSIYVRSSNTLTLIPQETSDTVQVAGALDVAGSAGISGKSITTVKTYTAPTGQGRFHRPMSDAVRDILRVSACLPVFWQSITSRHPNRMLLSDPVGLGIFDLSRYQTSASPLFPCRHSLTLRAL